MSNKRNNPKKQLPKRRKPKGCAVKAKKPIHVEDSTDIYSEDNQKLLKTMMGACGTGLTTPVEITDEIKQFAKELSGTPPIRVPVVGMACIGRCHLNVLEYCKAYGGEPVFGWMVWESKKPKRINAEFHCVVQEIDGSYLDITRKADKESEIVFVPDRNRRVEFGGITSVTQGVFAYCNDCEKEKKR